MLMEQASQFRHTGSLHTAQKDIWNRIDMAKKAFMEKKWLFTVITGKINLELNNRIMKCCL